MRNSGDITILNCAAGYIGSLVFNSLNRVPSTWERLFVNPVQAAFLLPVKKLKKSERFLP
jgi:hypothetical protein